MRTALAILVLIAAGALSSTAKADPYRWCADYAGSGMGGSKNCYFVTLEQCRATVSGVGGYCTPNPFYDGRPVVTPDDTVRVRRRSRIY